MLPSVASTQDVARRRHAETGTAVLVVAEHQTAGRGRTGRTWLEAPQALFSSLAFRPAWPVVTWPRLTLVTGLAVRAALARVAGVAPRLKWPNDLVMGEAKVGGILTESAGELVVVGCGVNLWWPAPPEGIGAVFADDPGEAAALAVAHGWASHVLATAAGEPADWGREEYRSACVTLGADVTWDPSGRGRAEDIDEDGSLVVATATGQVTLGSGEVRTVRGATVAADEPNEAGGRQK